VSGDSKEIRKYDDILEEDNRLPNWWLMILFGSIVFSFGYWLVFHTTNVFANPTAAYLEEVGDLKRQRAMANPTSEEALKALADNPESVAEGQKVFMATCASCHGQNAEGLVGPNLTDKFWIHGATGQDILRSVNEGFAEKGMPAWGPVIGADKARKVTAFVLSVKGKDRPGKEPQGTPVVE
jgi:cytochrome c oxidase cbb3-type subunit 3